MKVPLLEYLDKLEATAKAATPGTWGSANWNEPDSRQLPHDTIESHRAPASESERSIWKGDVAVRIAEITDECDNPEGDRAHILATQPKATLALIAKLREYHKRLAELCNEIAQSSEDPDDLDDVRAFLADGIEVPE